MELGALQETRSLAAEDVGHALTLIDRKAAMTSDELMREARKEKKTHFLLGSQLSCAVDVIGRRRVGLCLVLDDSDNQPIE